MHGKGNKVKKKQQHMLHLSVTHMYKGWLETLNFLYQHIQHQSAPELKKKSKSRRPFNKNTQEN